MTRQERGWAHNEVALLLLEDLDCAAPDLGRLRLEAPQLPLVRLCPALACTAPTLPIQPLNMCMLLPPVEGRSIVYAEQGRHALVRRAWPDLVLQAW